MRWLLVLLGTAIAVGWSAARNGALKAAWGLPDVAFYLHMAEGRIDLVPEPFSARPLAPLVARWFAHGFGTSIRAGFGVLAYVSVLCTVFVVFWLLCRSGAPRWTLLLVAVVPFWPQLLGDAGLPDALYTALLAVLLLLLAFDWMWAAALMMFPLMLARESTWLTLLCLLLVCGRRLRWAGSAVAVGSAVVGAVVVRRLSAGGLPNPEHLSGGLYMGGKLVTNTLRSVGVVPWSNVYTSQCAVPAWQVPLHAGTVAGVGVCGWSSRQPKLVVAGLLLTFGLLPCLLLLPRKAAWLAAARGGDAVMRFALLYGAVSLVIAPALGTWYGRLFGYGWPLLLVTLPQLLETYGGDPSGGGRAKAWGAGVVAGWMVIQLALCWLGAVPVRGPVLAWAVVLEGAGIALILVQRVRGHGVAESA